MINEITECVVMIRINYGWLCQIIADKIGPTMAVMRQDIDKNIQVNTATHSCSKVRSIIFLSSLIFTSRLYEKQKYNGQRCRNI